MNEETILQLGEKTEQALQALGDKLGQGAEYVWPLLIRQHFGHGVVGAAATAFFFILAACLLIMAYRSHKHMVKNEISWDDFSMSGVTIVVGVMVGLLMLFVAIVEFFRAEALLKILNPEYYALQEIMQLIN